MKENRGRAQLIFRLDDPVQKEAFDILQNRVYRGKAVYVAKCIVAQENEEKMAERIAQKIVETLSRQTPPVIQPPKRKRGRPPKQASAPTISESEPRSVDSSAPPKRKRGRPPKRTDIPTIIEPPLPSSVDSLAPPKENAESVKKQTPPEPSQDILSPALLETSISVPLPKPASENTFTQQESEDADGIPDDEMLQSMESFISGLTGSF